MLDMETPATLGSGHLPSSGANDRVDSERELPVGHPAEAVSDDVSNAIERQRSNSRRKRYVARDVEGFGIAQIWDCRSLSSGTSANIHFH
jgi:hypothetical protein